MTYSETSVGKDKPEPKGKKDKDALLEKARDCYKLACDAEANQRKREKEDLEFQVADNQWDPVARQQRMSSMSNGVATPARPILSISLLHQPGQLVQNQATAAKLGVNIHPVSETSDKETAEVMQGLYRRIERDSNADQARLWALDRARQCGRGWYRVVKEFDEDAPAGSFDQEIRIKRFLHQSRVYMDPASQEADFSDARWAFVISKMKYGDFKKEFPEADVAVNGDLFSDLEEEYEDWYTGDGDERQILVAEYWYKDIEKTEEKTSDGRKRKREEVTVYTILMTGSQFLEDEPTKWDGKYIPLIPVIGRELQPFDNDRRWEGMVRPARDGQKLFNFAASTLVERMASEPKTPWIGAEGQFEGHEPEWDQANVRNLPRLEYKPVALGDKMAPPPMRAQLDQTGMSLAMMALQEGKSFVQSATAIYDPSLGKPSEKPRSGRSIQADQQQADASTSNYLQNLANVSMMYEARVILDLIPKVYDAAGRVTTVLGGEDDVKTVMLNAPYVMEGGRPRMLGKDEQNAEGKKLHDFRNGKYAVSVNVGRSYQTRLQQGSEEIGAILEARPELMPIIGPTYFRFRDFPGAQEIADMLKKMRDRQFPFLNDTNEGETPTPEQAQAKAQALEQKMQEMQKQMEGMMQYIQTEQTKSQATLQKAQMDNQAKVMIAQDDNRTKAQISAADNRADLLIAKLEAVLKMNEAAKDRTQERHISEHDSAHEIGMASMNAQHATAQAVTDAMLTPPDLSFAGDPGQSLDPSGV